MTKQESIGYLFGCFHYLWLKPKYRGYGTLIEIDCYVRNRKSWDFADAFLRGMIDMREALTRKER